MPTTFLTNLLDLVYPPACHHCDTPTQHGRYLCPQCCQSSTPITPPFCQRCGEAFDGKITSNFSCPNCQSLNFPFEFAIAALKNTQQNHQLITDFKYRKQFHLAEEIARFCANTLTHDPRFSTLPNPVLVPVPLHWTRQWRRGFNQSLEITRCLSKLTNIPYHCALSRSRRTPSQTKLSRKQRLKNLQNAFRFSHLPPEFQSVILIDDVFTTGATTTACSHTLLENTAVQQICVLTSLRG